VKKFAADKGSADKAAVAAGMVRLWGERVEPGNDNEFDALALATLGAVHVARRQLPVRVLERHLEVVTSIGWPEVSVKRPV
jgi:Holliday junction resolvasome RuvABC endonuclease subunit